MCLAVCVEAAVLLAAWWLASMRCSGRIVHASSSKLKNRDQWTWTRLLDSTEQPRRCADI